MGCVVNATPRPIYAPGKDPVPIVQEAGWAPGPVWTDAGNLAPENRVVYEILWKNMVEPDRP